jgi:hypothetical protein
MSSASSRVTSGTSGGRPGVVQSRMPSPAVIAGSGK